MAAGKIRLITLATAFMAIVVVEFLARVPVKAGMVSPLAALLGARLAQAILMLAGIRLWQGTLAVVGLGNDDHVRGLKTGLTWAVVFGGLAAAAGALMLAAGESPLPMFRMNLSCCRGLALYFLTGAVVSPFAEELFFRGLLYGFFRRWGVAVGIALSTTVFAGLHLTTPALPVTQIIGGIVFCLAYERGKSLLAPYVIHVLGNAAIFTLGVLG